MTWCYSVTTQGLRPLRSRGLRCYRVPGKGGFVPPSRLTGWRVGLSKGVTRVSRCPPPRLVVGVLVFATVPKSVVSRLYSVVTHGDGSCDYPRSRRNYLPFADPVRLPPSGRDETGLVWTPNPSRLDPIPLPPRQLPSRSQRLLLTESDRETNHPARSRVDLQPKHVVQVKSDVQYLKKFF